MTAPFYEDARNGAAIYCGDCLDVLPTLPDSSVDLILTDPPFYKVKDEGWDNQWATPADFLAWLDRVLVEFARVLKPNGSLYMFASPQMSARVECLIAARFEVLNNILWRKIDDNAVRRHAAQIVEKDLARSYYPEGERIIFAEHLGADSAAKGEAGYEKKCDELRGFIFEPILSYLAEQLVLSRLTRASIDDYFKTANVSQYWWQPRGFILPTREKYVGLQLLAPGFFRKEYEELRKEYEELRRPFTVSSKVPYTDVWDFETVGTHPGKHICEKPMPLLRHMISASSRPGAVVLDAFGGSCSTADAAKQLRRRSITIERDEKWCRRGAARLSQEVLPLFAG